MLLISFQILNSNPALTLGYLNPALNNSAQVINLQSELSGKNTDRYIGR